MKLKILISSAALLLFAFSAFSQSVVITSEKVKYTRPRPQSRFKDNFEINYPKVKAKSSAVSKKIKNNLSYEKAFDFKISDELKDREWLEQAGYEVKYNNNGVLVVRLFIEGSAAYPSSSSKTVVIDTNTGNLVLPESVFTNTNQLIEKIRERQSVEIKESIAEIKKEAPELDNPAAYFEDKQFKAENLRNFLIDDKGIAFLFDYEFPHAILNLEPVGEYYFTWAELRPFIKRGGLLARFIR